MHSFIFRSAIFSSALAALLVSVPLATASAASHGHGGNGPHASGRAFDGSLDEGFPDNPAYMQDFYGYSAPSTPVYIQTGRVDTVLGDLRAADGRVAADRDHRRLSAAEAHALDAQIDAIRNEAVRAADRDGGSLPATQYDALMRRIHGLDRAIDRDAA